MNEGVWGSGEKQFALPSLKVTGVPCGERTPACLVSSEEGFGGWRNAQKKNYTHLLAGCAIFSLVRMRQGINFHGIFFLKMQNYC